MATTATRVGVFFLLLLFVFARRKLRSVTCTQSKFLCSPTIPPFLSRLCARNSPSAALVVTGAFLTSIVNSTLRNVVVNCIPTRIVQSVVPERWANIQAQTWRLEAAETLQLINSNLPYYVTLSALAFNASLQFSSTGILGSSKRDTVRQKRDDNGCPSSGVLENVRIPSTGGNIDAECFVNVMRDWNLDCGLLSVWPFGTGGCAVRASENALLSLMYDNSTGGYSMDQINNLLQLQQPIPGGANWANCNFINGAGLGINTLRGCLLAIINDIAVLKGLILTNQQQTQTLFEQSLSVQSNFASLQSQLTEINQNLANQASISSQAAYAQDLTKSMVNNLATSLAITQTNQEDNNLKILQALQQSSNTAQAMGINYQAQIDFMTQYNAAALTLVEQQIYRNVFVALSNINTQLQIAQEQQALEMSSFATQLQNELNTIADNLATNDAQVGVLMGISGNLVRGYGDVVNVLSTAGVLPMYTIAAYQQMNYNGLLPFIGDYGVPVSVLDDLYLLQARNFSVFYPQICMGVNGTCRSCQTPLNNPRQLQQGMNAYYANNRVATFGVQQINDWSFPQYSDTILIQAQVNGQWYFLTTTSCQSVCTSACPNAGSPPVVAPAICLTNNPSSAASFIIQSYATFLGAQKNQTDCQQIRNTPITLSTTNVTDGDIVTQTTVIFLLACDPKVLDQYDDVISCSGRNQTSVGVIVYNLTCVLENPPNPEVVCIISRNDTSIIIPTYTLAVVGQEPGQHPNGPSERRARAQAEVNRVELSLRQRLARTYACYRAAQVAVEEYRKGSLPEAKEAYELYLESYHNRRAAWPQVLVAQRTYFQLSVDYVNSLEQLRRRGDHPWSAPGRRAGSAGRTNERYAHAVAQAGGLSHKMPVA